MKYFAIFDNNVERIFQLQGKIGNISAIFCAMWVVTTVKWTVTTFKWTIISIRRSPQTLIILSPSTIAQPADSIFDRAKDLFTYSFGEYT